VGSDWNLNPSIIKGISAFLLLRKPDEPQLFRHGRFAVYIVWSRKTPT